MKPSPGSRRTFRRAPGVRKAIAKPGVRRHGMIKKGLTGEPIGACHTRRRFALGYRAADVCTHDFRTAIAAPNARFAIAPPNAQPDPAVGAVLCDAGGDCDLRRLRAVADMAESRNAA